MKRVIFFAVVVCVIYLSFFHVVSNAHSIGLTEVKFVDTSRVFDGKPRVLNVLIWYPTDSKQQTQKIEHKIWKMHDAAKGAPILFENKKLPLILFSHGYASDPYGTSWFAEYLASRGYIVAAVTHFGNSYFNKILEISARPWNRPQDISFVLSELLENSIFAHCIDENRIGAAGFSQGGMTVSWLSGIQANFMKPILNKYLNSITDDKELKNVLENFTAQDFDDANKSYYDERIKAIFAMAPGIAERNFMFTSKEKLSQATIPVCFVAGEADDIVSTRENSQFFAQYIPKSNITIFPGKVDHWTFMNESTADGKNLVPLITVDDSSVNRAKIHEIVGSMALDFFDINLR